MISFRKGELSGRGPGRIRYYVDLDGKYIGSIEGVTGDYSLDCDAGPTHAERAAAPHYHSRQDAAEALSALVQRADKPPIGRPEYDVLVLCNTTGLPQSTPSLSMARMLAGRGLLKAGRTATDYRTTAAGKKAIEKYDRWHADRSKPAAATTTTTSNEGG